MSGVSVLGYFTALFPSINSTEKEQFYYIQHIATNTLTYYPRLFCTSVVRYSNLFSQMQFCLNILISNKSLCLLKHPPGEDHWPRAQIMLFDCGFERAQTSFTPFMSFFYFHIRQGGCG